MKPEKHAKKKARSLQARHEHLPRSAALRRAGRETARAAGIRSATPTEIKRAARFDKENAANTELDPYDNDAVRAFRKQKRTALEEMRAVSEAL